MTDRIPADRIALTPREAADAVGLGLRTIQQAYLSGDLPVYYRTPRRPRILVDDLRTWLASAPTERAS